ncbi:MAG: hypothetical protein A2Y50_02245 [Pseudomonadales bacterium RIFCSPLOWO2_12_59_9]|nr:MAG: hypothetical protein A2Y50_02245 [Pseudomonadales bacterium RIFCSPLOWO2_12_59_9]
MVIAETVVIQACRIPLLARVADGFVLGFSLRFGRHDGGAAIGVIFFLTEDLAVRVQFDLAAAKMISQAVSQLTVIDVRRASRGPMEHAELAGHDDLKLFIGVAFILGGADFKSRQVEYLLLVGAAARSACAGFGNAHAIATVNIRFFVVAAITFDHGGAA